MLMCRGMGTQVERSYWNEMGWARFAKWLQLGTENHRKQKTQRVNMIFKKRVQYFNHFLVSQQIKLCTSDARHSRHRRSRERQRRVLSLRAHNQVVKTRKGVPVLVCYVSQRGKYVHQ